MIVDGVNHPITAGNFINLINKKLYDEKLVNNQNINKFSSISSDTFENGNEILNRVLFGSLSGSGSSSVSSSAENLGSSVNSPKKIPLEILREEIAITG